MGLPVFGLPNIPEFWLQNIAESLVFFAGKATISDQDAEQSIMGFGEKATRTIRERERDEFFPKIFISEQNNVYFLEERSMPLC